ncbi:MAG: efflux RND transporter periplasmic adaptor subunit [Verrucomicrobiota bacterium]|nr:efflux RND transporter periplasmic adaptor subunit [Verrucomicrobiota bacterium]
MKKGIIIFILLAVIAAVAALLNRQTQETSRKADSRKVLFYQSAMHPWIKSDKPGNCTICGMKLSPVYEGEQSMGTNENLVLLGSNTITVLNVATEKAAVRPLSRRLTVAGTIDDNESTHRIISAYVDARVDKLWVNFLGAEVRAGEPMVSIYSPALLTAEQEYLTLLRRQNSGITGLPGEAHQELLAAAQGRLLRMGLSEAQIAGIQDKSPTNFQSEILAPISGTVVLKQIYEGQYVKEGEPLFEISDFSTMWFLFDAYERDLAFLRPGQKVIVRPAATPDKKFEGQITFINPNIDPMTRSSKVRVEIPNPLININGRQQRLLFHRSYAEADVQIEQPSALAVPREAVLQPGHSPRIYVEREPGAYEPRLVELGFVGDTHIEIRSGLSEGEKVVLQGNMLIDAQAQLSNVPHPAVHSHGSQTSINRDKTATALSTKEQSALNSFVQASSAISAALASDDFSAASAALPAYQESLRVVMEIFQGHPTIHEWHTLQEIELSNENIKRLRQAFSQQNAALNKIFKTIGAPTNGILYQCPMFPRPGKTAYWVQAAGPLRNPYWGAEMLECGTAIKPNEQP